MKGIKKKKKSKMVWDETEQSWKRRHGYDRANDPSKQWLIEAKPTDQDPFTDPFKKIEQEKKERVKKQKKREERNRMEAGVQESGKMGGVQSINTKPSPKELGKDIDRVAKSTASVGKFNTKLREEPKEMRIKGKRKFDAVAGEKGAGAEKQANLSILDKVMKAQEAGGDPSQVAEAKVTVLQKKKVGKKHRKTAY